MAKYTTNEVLDLVFEKPANENDIDEDDSGDDFDGYVDDDNTTRGMVIQQDESIVDNRGIENDFGNIDDENGDDDDEQSDSPMSEESLPLPEFSGSSSCSTDMSDKTPIEFFELLFTDDILHNVVDQTNLYAEQHLQEKMDTDLPPRSRLRLWKKKAHTTIEFIQFLSLIIIMGIINLPQIEDHWIKSWPYANTTFSRVMSRDRFSLIMKFLHLNDNKKYIKKGNPGYDPIYKLRPLYNSLMRNFKLAYNLGRELSLDESMIGFKGRVWFIQYMPKKPNKWGMKAFVLADAITGYTYNWSLYAGIQ